MYSYPNQNFIRIHKQSYSRDFLQIGINEWQKASRDLTPSAFKIYLYLASNADNYKLALSKQDIKDTLGISFSRYYEATKLLRQLHYICCSGSNQFHFFLSPNPDYEKEHGLQEWDSPESVQLNPKSEKDLPKSEKLLPEKNIEIDNIDKTNNKDLGKSKPTLAINLDHVLFNGLASEDDLRTIQKWIDVDAYNRVEQRLLKDNWGNDEKYRSSVLLYLSQLLDMMKDTDVNALENLINHIIQEASTNE